MNLLTELESLILYLNLFKLRKNKVALLEKEASAFIALAEVFTHMTSKIDYKSYTLCKGTLLDSLSQT